MKREKLGRHVDPENLRVRGLNAHQLLRGAELEGANRPAHLGGRGA